VSTPIDGWCAPGFAPVRESFAANFAERGELGGAVHVIVDGAVVVDLVGGWADEARTRPWRPDTIVDFYSAGKALLAVLALQLVDEGRMALDQPVADLWPAFAAGGKEGATVRHALSHRAGVPAIREPLTDDDLFDWERMTGALAATEAWWVPGERLAYHTNTFGHLNGELVRRAGGASVGDRLRALAGPLDADVWFGVPAAEQHRCADVVWDPAQPMPPVAAFDGLEGDVLMNMLAHFNPPGYSSVGVVNTPAWRATPIARRAAMAPRPAWPASTRRCWSRAGWSPPRCSPTRSGRGPPGTARSWARTSSSASASSPPPRSGRSAPTRTATATSARVAPSASPTPTGAWPSATS